MARLLILLLVTACATRESGVWLEGAAHFRGEETHAGILVTVGGRSAFTDDTGAFRLGPVAPGRFSVIYASSDSLEGRLERSVVVGADALTLEPVELQPVAHARGLVVDGVTGDPLPGALVMADSRTVATTDGEGRFELHALPVHAGAVVVSLVGYHPVVRSTSATRGEVVELGTLSLVPARPDDRQPLVAGSVTLGPGAPPISGAEVTLTMPGHTQTTATDAAGAFEFLDVPTGVVSLHVRFQRYDADVESVLVVPGASGFVTAEGLYPLSEFPIPLAMGVRRGTGSGTSTPDRKWLVGPIRAGELQGLQALPIDEGLPNILVTPQEGGLYGASVLRFSADSTVAELSMPSMTGEQIFLSSVNQAGRHLVSSRGCGVSAIDLTPVDEVYVLDAPCNIGGPAQLLRQPFRIGAPTRRLGEVRSVQLLNSRDEWLVDRSPTALEVMRFDGTRTPIGSAEASVMPSPDGNALLVLDGCSTACSLTLRSAADFSVRGTIAWVGWGWPLQWRSVDRVIWAGTAGDVQQLNFTMGSRQVVASGMSVLGLVWDDVALVRYRSGEDTGLLNVETGALRRVGGSTFSYAILNHALLLTERWSPGSDRGRLVYVDEEANRRVLVESTQLQSVAVSPRGDFFASIVSEPEPAVVLTSLATQQSHRFPGMTDRADAAAFSPEGGRALVQVDTVLLVVDLSSGATTRLSANAVDGEWRNANQVLYRERTSPPWLRAEIRLVTLP